MANAGSNNVSVIDVASRAVVANVPVGRKPLILSVAPDGRSVYAGNAADGTVSVIDTPGQSVRETLVVGGSPIGVGVSPDGKRLYVADNAAGRLVVLDPSAGTVVDRLPVGAKPVGLAVSPFAGRTPSPGGLPQAGGGGTASSPPDTSVRVAWMVPAGLVLLGMGLAAWRLLRPREAGNVTSERIDWEA